jgi:hypothetical protein
VRSAITFSNAVQLGIPVMAAIFGTAGLTVHIAIVSLQALVLLTTGTVLAEIDLARAGAKETRGSLARVIGQTARRSLIHPVVLPIVAGLVFNATGLAIPNVVDDILVTLGAAVVPVSLVTIGLTLQAHGVAGVLRPAIAISAVKLLIQPTLVFSVAYLGFGLRGPAADRGDDVRGAAGRGERVPVRRPLRAQGFDRAAGRGHGGDRGIDQRLCRHRHRLAAVADPPHRLSRARSSWACPATALTT